LICSRAISGLVWKAIVSDEQLRQWDRRVGDVHHHRRAASPME